MFPTRVKHTLVFAGRVLKHFQANQGMMLAGSVAFYSLLSIIPLFTLFLILLSYIIPQQTLLLMAQRYLALLVSGQSATLIKQVHALLSNHSSMSILLASALLLFSLSAFNTLENALAVIFHHRTTQHRRHFLVSAVIPFLFIGILGVGLFAVTGVTIVLQAVSGGHLVMNVEQSDIGPWFGLILSLLGFMGETLIFSSIYMIMPVGMLPWRHALLGGFTAAALWEITRRVMVWYLFNVSYVDLIYGSLSTLVVLLISLETVAVLVLLGAQVIAEWEAIRGAL